MFSLTSLLLQAYASKGYVCVAIDSRYHGERASNETTYIEVIIYLWSYNIVPSAHLKFDGDIHLFYFVWLHPALLFFLSFFLFYFLLLNSGTEIGLAEWGYNAFRF